MAHQQKKATSDTVTMINVKISVDVV